jgi:hypothetical protein
MNFNDELRTVLQEEAKQHTAPEELKGKILEQVMSTQGGRRMKKWIVSSILAAALLIPTGVYAGYNYLTDSIYGSQEAVASIGVTQQQYDRLEAKLQNAKQSFNEEEFTKLMSLLKELGDFNVRIGDSEGVFHVDQLNADEQAAYKNLVAELEPYFKQLNEATAPNKSAPVVDRDAFWTSVLEKAEQRLTKQESVETERLINELRSYDAKVFDADGSVHMDRLSDADKANQEKLMEALDPYMNKLDLMVKPSA